MRKKKITMQEIAQKAGVSLTTVSHIVNKTRYVAKDTREQVLKVIREENYQKSKQKLKPKGKQLDDANLIGVIVANLREDFYIAVVQAIETAASENDISILLFNSEDDYQKEKKNISNALGQGISGLIIASMNYGPVPELFQTASMPVILLDRDFKDHHFTFIGIDNFGSAMTAANYLLNKGCASIAFFGYSEKIYTVKQRILGCKAAIMEANKAPLKVLHLNADNEDSFALIKEFLTKNKIDGIVTDTNDLCYEALSVLDELKIGIPDDIKIITFDYNKWMDFIKYPISIISQPTSEIGNHAIKQMMQYIRHPETRSEIKTEILFDIEIIDRL